MSFPRYERYKDSGVEWLGEVPERWVVASVKYSFQVIGGSTPKSDYDAFWDGEIVWVTPADLSRITGMRVSDSLRKLTASGLASCGATMVPRGSIIISTRAPIGSLAIAETDLCTNQGCKSLIRSQHADSLFFAYLFSASTHELNIQGKGTTFLELSGEELRAFKTTVPTVDEQRSIAAFLDLETGKIDALIAEQRHLTELLKEKRQATISHAVTKGLDPEAPMKDSDVEWLGDVPEHWKVIRLRFIAAVQTGVAKGKDNSGLVTIEVPYLRVANVQDGYLDLEDIATIEIPLGALQRYSLRVGDVLMNEGGDFDKLGRGHIWHGEIDPCIHQNHVFAVRPTAISSMWLNTVTGSQYAQFYFMTRSKQSTNLASISSSNIMELPIVIPPENEQEAILSYIAKHVREANLLIAEAEMAISLLHERRIALISSAVTGKIDVRGAVARELVAV